MEPYGSPDYDSGAIGLSAHGGIVVEPMEVESMIFSVPRKRFRQLSYDPIQPV